MRVVIRKDRTAMAAYAAEYIKNRIVAFNPTAERPFVIGLPTGSTPIPVYNRLVQYYKVCFLDLFFFFLSHTRFSPGWLFPHYDLYALVTGVRIYLPRVCRHFYHLYSSYFISTISINFSTIHFPSLPLLIPRPKSTRTRI
jgi:hypothetical protein